MRLHPTDCDLLRRRREAAGWSLADLGARLGLSRQFIGQVETGRRAVSPARLAGWLELLDLELIGDQPRLRPKKGKGKRHE